MSTEIFDGNYKQLGEYVRDLADKMGLRDWHIDMMHAEPDNENHAACMRVTYGQRHVSVWFRKDWANSTPDQLRCTVVHELVHCHINPLRNCIDNIKDAVGGMIYDPLYLNVTDYIEYAVDAISYAWAPSLPLPTKTKKKKS